MLTNTIYYSIIVLSKEKEVFFMSYKTKYWRQYWRDFGNTYNLVYTVSEEEEKRLLDDPNSKYGCEHITRKQALREARENKTLHDLVNECYAPTAILPYSFVENMDIVCDFRNFLSTSDGFLYV